MSMFCSSHDDAHPDNPTLHTGAVRPHPGFVERLLFISSRNGARAQVYEVLPAFSCISWVCVFAGDGAAMFFSGLIGFIRGYKISGRLNGLAHLEFRGESFPC